MAITDKIIEVKVIQESDLDYHGLRDFEYEGPSYGDEFTEMTLVSPTTLVEELEEKQAEDKQAPNKYQRLIDELKSVPDTILIAL